MFVPLTTMAISQDYLRRLCLEFWQASVDGQKDDGTLQHLFKPIVAQSLNHWQEHLEKAGRVLPRPIFDKEPITLGSYREIANLDTFICEPEPMDHFEAKLARVRDVGGRGKLPRLSKQLKWA
jgi:hypothetical protein